MGTTSDRRSSDLLFCGSGKYCTTDTLLCVRFVTRKRGKPPALSSAAIEVPPNASPPSTYASLPAGGDESVPTSTKRLTLPLDWCTTAAMPPLLPGSVAGSVHSGIARPNGSPPYERRTVGHTASPQTHSN